MRLVISETRPGSRRKIVQSFTPESIKIVFHPETPGYSDMTPGESAYVEMFVDGKLMNYGWSESAEFEITP